MRIVIFLGTALFFLGAAVGCNGEREEQCQAACVRPFELAENKAKNAEAVWQTLPEPQRTQALDRYSGWQKTHDAEREAWLSRCVPACESAADDTLISCREKAANTAAWKRCGGGS